MKEDHKPRENWLDRGSRAGRASGYKSRGRLRIPQLGRMQTEGEREQGFPVEGRGEPPGWVGGRPATR